MLKMRDIDFLQYKLQNGDQPKIYYIAHKVELREGLEDEITYKSKPEFSVIEIEVQSVQNALCEVMNFQQFPYQYHTVAQTVILSPTEKYVYHYTASNVDLKIPSIIYGASRTLYQNGSAMMAYNDPSPIQPVYTNDLSFMGFIKSACEKLFDDGELDWKYQKAPEGTVIDGISYKYITSPWYILETDDKYHLEHHLVNVNKKNALFLYAEDALSYKEELEA